MSKYFNDDILNEGIYTMANPSKNTVKDLGKVADHFLKVKESDPRYITKKQEEAATEKITREFNERKLKNQIATNKQKLDAEKQKLDAEKQQIFDKEWNELQTNKDKWVNDSDTESTRVISKDNKPSPNIPSAVLGPQTLKNKVDTVVNNIQAGPSRWGQITSNVYKNNKGAVAGAAVGAAAAVGVGAIIANILKKRKWKLDGCNKIEDPSKKQQCKEYIVKKNMSDINSQCKYSNNPEKCKRIAMEKIRDI